MEKIKKLFISTILLSILVYNFYAIINSNSYAQSTSSEISKINSFAYPGIKERIQLLQSKYPNWKFKILYTDLDWNTVIANEYVHTSSGSRNYVQATSNYQGAWICSACKYQDGLWRCASEEAIKYMMDPRNSLNETDIFQFEELTNSGYDINVIKQMTKGTFLAGYENLITKAADTTGVSSYYIVGRMIQEQGTSGTALTSGVKIDGASYFNPFNIQANGSNPINAGAVYAKSQGWNTLEKGIIGGINFLSTEYTKKGQNTLYLQKFDVDSRYYGLYWHQYMQNIMAAQSEGTTLRKTYEKINAKGTAHTFIIPVYKNMPATACARPNSSGTSVITSDVVRVNVNSTIGLRQSPNGNRLPNAYLSKDEIVTRVEKATSKVGGTYWDKVRKADGTEAYVARETYDYEKEYKLYLVPVNNNSNNNNSSNNNSSSNNSNSNNNSNNNSDKPSNTSKIKIDEESKIITVVPSISVSDILEKLGKNAKITKSDGTLVTQKDKLVATGDKVNEKYIIIKKGDCNGDGAVNTGDTYMLKCVVLNMKKFENDIYKKAADVNSDNELNTGDTFLLKKQVLGLSNLEL